MTDKAEVLLIYRCNKCGYMTDQDEQAHLEPKLDPQSFFVDEDEPVLYCEGEFGKLGATVYADETMESIQDQFETRMNKRVDILVARGIKELTEPATTLDEAANRTKSLLRKSANKGVSSINGINDQLKAHWQDAIKEQLNDVTILKDWQSKQANYQTVNTDNTNYTPIKQGQSSYCQIHDEIQVDTDLIDYPVYDDDGWDYDDDEEDDY